MLKLFSFVEPWQNYEGDNVFKAQKYLGKSHPIMYRVKNIFWWMQIHMQTVLSWPQELAQGKHWGVSQGCPFSESLVYHRVITWSSSQRALCRFHWLLEFTLIHYLFPEYFTTCSALAIPKVGQAWLVIHYFTVNKYLLSTYYVSSSGETKKG